jgi:outer membrane protein assembly factor BamB
MTRSFRLTAALALLAGLSVACRPGSPPSAAGTGPAAAAGGDKGHDGPVTWLWPAPAPASTGMPAADEREVAFTYGHEHLVLLDAGGSTVWDVARLGLRDVAPRLTDDLVLAAADDGMSAFRRADGTKLWDTPLQARPNTPVVVGRLAVTSTWEGTLVALDLATGKVAWTLPLGGAAIGPPAADAAGLVVVTWEQDQRQGAGAVAVDGSSGRKRWSVPLPPGGVSAPGLTPDGLAVVVAGDLAAHGLALADGKERWRTAVEGAGSPEVPPVAVGPGTVLTAHRLGGLDLLDTGTGGRTWQVRTDGAAVRGGPVVAPGGNSFAFPLDDGRMLLAGPTRPTELRQAPGRISGLAVGPGGLLVAATRGAAVNTVQATPRW